MHVLVADDDPGSLLVVQAVIEGLGHSCSVAPDGEAAWRLIQSSRPDVLITDWLMPGIDGVELCRRVRAGGQESYTYVIVTTASGDRGDVLRGMEAGADDYLIKPVEPFDLESRLIAARRMTELHRELDRSRAQLERLNKELGRLACTDPLTQLRNRLSLWDDLDGLHARSVRYGYSYALAICDVDFFKEYNDRFGHQAGDEALQVVATVLAASVRRADTVYRYGGEEFLVVLPEQDAGSAVVALERVRRALRQKALPGPTGGPASVLTISAGITVFHPGRATSPAELLKEADVALYRAKETGRDCVVGYAT